MIDIWKRGVGRSAEVASKAKDNGLGLTDAAMVELINLAASVRFEAGACLLQQTPELARALVLFRSGDVSVEKTGRTPLVLSSGDVLNDLTALLPSASASDCMLKALSEGQLFYVSRAQFAQLREQTQLVLLQRAYGCAARLSSRLAVELEQTSGCLAQLVGRHYNESQRLAVGLDEDESLRSVIGRIPRLPVSSLDLLQCLLDEDSTRAQIVDLVRQDPAMTATLLKALNSPGYSFDKKITDLSHAVTLLGFEGVYQVIMAETLRKSLPDSEVFRTSYQRALALSYIVFALAQATAKGRPAEMATIALLHDIGRLVLAVWQRQQPASRALIRRVPSGLPGSLLLRDWLLPEAVWQVIALQHYPMSMPPEQLPAAWREPVALLHVASWMLDQRQGRSGEAPFVEAYLAQLGMPSVPVEQLWQQKVAPLLRQRRNALPASLRKLID
ncbi:MAG: HDOD domain-containing protein [Oceanospirillales bacterium]|nr:HDOD domain-containing protein [Oceanospirillales bacterium]